MHQNRYRKSNQEMKVRLRERDTEKRFQSKAGKKATVK